MSRPAPERRVLDEAGGARVMTGVMGVMVFLTVLAAALGLSTAEARRALDRQLAGRLTVQLVEGDAAARAAAATAALRTLRALPEVARAEQVPPAELRRLLAPWLGANAGEAGLPIPAMIDVDLADAGGTTAARVTAALRRAVPGARAEAQAAWMSPVGGFMRALVWLAAMLVALMVAATAAVVMLAARAGLETHRATVEVMHMLGSTDRQVARLFQRRLALDAALGGGLGAGIAAGVVALIGVQVGGLGSELVGAARLSTGDGVVLALVPVGFVLLATLAARLAITRALGRQL
jgi:cell division transport system permease protein